MQRSSIHTLPLSKCLGFYKHLKLNNANHSNNGQAEVFRFDFRQVLKLREISWLLLLALRMAEIVASNEY